MNTEEIVNWLKQLSRQYSGEDCCNKVYSTNDWQYVDEICNNAIACINNMETEINSYLNAIDG